MLVKLSVSSLSQQIELKSLKNSGNGTNVLINIILAFEEGILQTVLSMHRYLAFRSQMLRIPTWFVTEELEKIF